MQEIEKFSKHVSLFLSNCIDTFFSLIKVLLQSKFRIDFPIAKAEKCIILGNGPSLKQSLQSQITFFETYPLVCVNSFALTEEFITLKPAYYVMHDPGLWLSNSQLSQDIFNAISNKTSWDLILFAPRSARKSHFLTSLKEANNKVKITFYNYTIFKGFSGLAFSLFKRNLSMPQSQNVLVASVFLCLNLGFKEIFILGADHTWHQDIIVDKNNVLCIKHMHFYNKETVDIKPFYKGLHLKETFKMHEIYTAWSKVFLGYTVLRKYADYLKSNIYNASEVSFIDAFERKNLS